MTAGSNSSRQEYVEELLKVVYQYIMQPAADIISDYNYLRFYSLIKLLV